MVMSSFLTLFAKPPFSLKSAWLGYISYMINFLTDYVKEFGHNCDGKAVEDVE